VAATELLELRQ